MSQIDELLASGVTPDEDPEELGFAGTIERALRLSRGEKFDPIGGPDVQQSDFLEGLVDTAQRFTRGVLEPEVFEQSPIRAAEPQIIPNAAPDLIDEAQRVLGSAAPFVAGSALAPIASGGSFALRSGAEGLRGAAEEAATGGGAAEIAAAGAIGTAVPAVGATLGKLARPVLKKLGKGASEGVESIGRISPKEVVPPPAPSAERLLIEAGKERKLLEAGGVSFDDLVESASTGHVPSFRSVLTMLGVQPSEINSVISAKGITRGDGGKFLSASARGDKYLEYIRRVQEGSKLPEFPDPLIDVVGTRLAESESLAARGVEPPPLQDPVTDKLSSANIIARGEVFKEQVEKASLPALRKIIEQGDAQIDAVRKGLSPDAPIKGRVAQAEDTEAIISSLPEKVRTALQTEGILDNPIRLLKRLDRILRGRPFAQRGTKQFAFDKAIRDALRKAGLNKQQQDLVMFGPKGIEGGTEGMTPIERVLLGRRWDKASPQTRGKVAQQIARHTDPRKAAQFLKRAEDAGLDEEGLQTISGLLDDMNGKEIELFAGLPITGKNVLKLADVLREARAASMLLNLVTFGKNFGFTIFNQTLGAAGKEVGAVAEGIANVGRRLAGKEAIQSRPLGQSLAKAYGYWHGLPKILQGYGKQLRVMREEISRQGAIPGKIGDIVRTPFKILNWQDQMMYNREFASEMYRNAYNQASREVKGLGKIIQRTDDIIQQQVRAAGKATKSAGREAQEGLTRRAISKEKGEIVASLEPQLRKLSPSKQKDLIKIAARQARKNVVTKGLEPTEEEIKKKAQEILKSAAPEDVTDAKLASERAIFIAREGQQWDKFLDWVEGFDASSGRIASILWPFRRTPANEARELLRATPIGYATAFSRYNQLLNAGKDPIAARGFLFDEIGRASVGTAALLTIANMIENKWVGVNRFDTDKTPAQRATESATGARQDSVTIGDWNIPSRNLGGLGRMFMIAGNAVDAYERAEDAEDADGINTATALAKSLTVDPLIISGNELFLRDLSEAYEATQDPRRAATWAQRFGGSFIPSSARQFRRALFDGDLMELSEADRKKAAEQGFFENFQTGQQLEIGTKGRQRVGLFGEDLSPARGGKGLLGIKEKVDDPLVTKMLEIGAVHEAPAFLSGLETLMSTEDELTFLKAKGLYQKTRMSRMFQRPGFERLAVERQKKKLNDEFTKASTIVNKRARNMIKAGQPLSYRMLLRGLLASGEQ